MKPAILLSSTAALTIAIVWFAMADSPASIPTITGPSAPVEVDRSRSQRAPVAPATAPAGLPARAFELGVTHRYAYDGALTLRLGNRDGAHDEAIEQRLTGRLDMTPVSRDGALTHIEVSLVGPTLKHSALPGDHVVHTELAQPFMISVAESGRVEAVHVRRSWSMQARGLIKGIVGSTQLVRGVAEAARWSTHEEDTTGEYRADYIRASVADALALRKTKRSYRRLATVEGLVPPSNSEKVTVSGTTEITVGDDGWPERWDGTETMSAELGPITVYSVTRTQMERLDRVRSGRVHGLSPWSLDTVAVSGIAPDANTQHDEDRGTVDGASLTELMASVDAAAQLEGVPGDRAMAEAVGRLAASLRLQPDGAAELGQRIRGEAPSAATRAMVGALGAAGTAEAQAELAALATDADVEPAHRVGGTLALGLTDNPTPDSRDALLELARTDVGADNDEGAALRDTATLGLGNMHRQTQAAGGDAAGEDDAGETSLVAELIAMLDAASTVEEKMTCVLALGNTASPEAFPTLDALASQPGRLQDAAVYALRGIPLAQADARLMHVLVEGNPIVRMAALNALGFRQTAGYWPVLSQVMPGASTKVRRAIVDLAGQRAIGEPDARTVLTSAAEGDPDEGLRTAAQAYLSRVM